MASQLTEQELKQLSEGDIKWLKAQPRTLERDHLINIMQYWATDVSEARQLAAQNRTLVQGKRGLRQLLRRVVSHYKLNT